MPGGSPVPSGVSPGPPQRARHDRRGRMKAFMKALVSTIVKLPATCPAALLAASLALAGCQTVSEQSSESTRSEPGATATGSRTETAKASAAEQNSGTSGAGTESAGQRPEPEADPGAGSKTGPSAPSGEDSRASAMTAAHTDDPAGDADDDPREAGTGAPNNSDERFREAIERFDRRLDRERFGTTGGGGGGGGGAGSGAEAGGGTEADAGQTGRNGTGGAMSGSDLGHEGEDASGPEQRGGVGAPTRYEPPPDIPDGSDDDIVARQLREAAENEPDPELRARLWEEYRAYKNDQSGDDQN
ncbi:MAG: hypothetical protein RQ847_02940 [Wenzhouxiangellaceae bacterium]|nr:hypothetical protein [Wenzhouxiangellaceae bacterium]